MAKFALALAQAGFVATINNRDGTDKYKNEGMP